MKKSIQDIIAFANLVLSITYNVIITIVWFLFILSDGQGYTDGTALGVGLMVLLIISFVCLLLLLSAYIISKKRKENADLQRGNNIFLFILLILPIIVVIMLVLAYS